MRLLSMYTACLQILAISLFSVTPLVTLAGPQCSALYTDASAPGATDNLRQDAIALVRRQTALLNKLFVTTGFANRDELKKVLNNLTGGQAEVRDLILHEQVAVGLAAPNLHRNSILIQGFLNQHETGASNVVYAPDFRDYSEASQLGINPNTVYRAMNSKMKAKYAMLEPAPNSLLTRQVNTYGDDIYFFNLLKIRDRMTWTPGDSLYRAKGYEPRAWDQIFLSWEDRMLMVPLLLNNDVQPGGILQFQSKAFGSYPVVIPIKTTNDNEAYIEIQIWGQLDLDDVAIFEYKKLPPVGDFLRELQSRGIEIRDGRKK